MLKEEKIFCFKEHLKQNNGSYSDNMRDELYTYFFENENNLDFLDELSSTREIVNKINNFVSKMIIHEDEDELFNIIELHI